MGFLTPSRLAVAAVALLAVSAHPVAAVPTSAGDPSKACGADGAYQSDAAADAIAGDASGRCFTVAKSVSVTGAPPAKVVTLKNSRFQQTLTVASMPADTGLLLENIWIDTTAEKALYVFTAVPMTLRRCDIRIKGASTGLTYGLKATAAVALTFEGTVMRVSSSETRKACGISTTRGTIASSGTWPGLKLTVRVKAGIDAVQGTTAVAGVQIDAESSSVSGSGVAGVIESNSVTDSVVNVSTTGSGFASGVIPRDPFFMADTSIQAVATTGEATGILGVGHLRVQRAVLVARSVKPLGINALGNIEAADVSVLVPLSGGKCKPLRLIGGKLALANFKCGELDSAGEPKGDATVMTGAQIAASLSGVPSVTPGCPAGYVVPFDATATNAAPMPAATTVSLAPWLPPAPLAALDKLCTVPFTMDPAVVPQRSGKATAVTLVGLPAGKTVVADLTAARLTVGRGVPEGAELVLDRCTLGGADKAADALVVAGAVGGAVRLGSGTTVTGRTVVDAVSAAGVLEFADGAAVVSASTVVQVKESFAGKLLIGKTVAVAMAKYSAAGPTSPPIVLKMLMPPCAVQHHAAATSAELFGKAAAAVNAACEMSTVGGPKKPGDPGSNPAHKAGAGGGGGSSVHPAAWAVPVAVVVVGALVAAAVVAWCVMRRRQQQTDHPAVKEEDVPGAAAAPAAEAELSAQPVAPVAAAPPAGHEPAAEQAAAPAAAAVIGEDPIEPVASGVVAVPVPAPVEDGL